MRKNKKQTSDPSLPIPEPLPLLEYQDQVSRLIEETDSDPDYARLKAIFAQLSKELEP